MMANDVPYSRLQEFSNKAGGSLPDDEFALACLLTESGLFDSDYYASSYKDVDQSGLDPVIHYLRMEHANERKPAPWFDGTFYLKEYPDVAKAGEKPFLHYLVHGYKEGRRPNAKTVCKTFPAADEESESAPSDAILYEQKKFRISDIEFSARFFRYCEEKTIETDNNLVFITDKNYAMATVVAANSYIVNSNKTINVFIIAIDCADVIFSEARKLLHKGANIRVISMYNQLGFIGFAEKYISEAGLYKFLVPGLLSNASYCLYVDSDTIAMAGWDDVFAIDLKNYIIGAITDFVAVYEHKRNDFLQLRDYFNSGVLLMNLVKMRSLGLPQKCLGLKLADKEGKYRFQDQDIFNVVYDELRLPLSPVYNYMLNHSFLGGTFTENFHVRVLPKDLRILHYSWLKPWLTKDALMGELWHDEYVRIHDRPHPLAPYTQPQYSEARQNEYFRLALPRRKSVLCIETLHCHGEVMPGFIKYFQEKGYNVDLLWHKDLDQLDSIALMDKTRVRKYWNWQFSHEQLLTPQKIEQYELLFFTSRTCYPGNPDGTFPNIYEVHPWLNDYKYKIVNMEHHLESITFPPSDNVIVLANPARKRELANRTVNFPYFGTVKIKRELGYPLRFIIVGNIEQHRKNFKLLLETLSSLNIDRKYQWHVDIIAMRNKLEIPPVLQDKISFYQALPFKDMYRKMEEADYIFALLDPDIKEHERYLESASSGTFQLAYGFRKPCIIHKHFASTFLFNEQNSIIYNSNQDFGKAIWKAIFMNKSAYTEMVDHMDDLCHKIINGSRENMDNILMTMNIN